VFSTGKLFVSRWKQVQRHKIFAAPAVSQPLLGWLVPIAQRQVVGAIFQQEAGHGEILPAFGAKPVRGRRALLRSDFTRHDTGVAFLVFGCSRDLKSEFLYLGLLQGKAPHRVCMCMSFTKTPT